MNCESCQSYDEANELCSNPDSPAYETPVNKDTVCSEWEGRPFLKPILFNTDMVRAILENRKTVTRRVVKPQPFAVKQDKNAPCWCGHFISESGKVLADKPPYRPGDILYVRETWCDIWSKDGTWIGYEYRANGEPNTDYWGVFSGGCPIKSFKWRPSIHMPREAARVFLRVAKVYPQQLKDATEADANAEGFRSRAEFISAILKMYSDSVEDNWFWVNEFERREKPRGD